MKITLTFESDEIEDKARMMQHIGIDRLVGAIETWREFLRFKDKYEYESQETTWEKVREEFYNVLQQEEALHLID